MYILIVVLSLDPLLPFSDNVLYHYLLYMCFTFVIVLYIPFIFFFYSFHKSHYLYLIYFIIIFNMGVITIF